MLLLGVTLALLLSGAGVTALRPPLPTMPPTPTPATEENLHKGARIKSYRVRSEVRFRYATTVVESHVKNYNATHSEEVAFTVILPESAYVTNFSMFVGGKEYVARVEKKEVASNVYSEAVDRGHSAGLVAMRDAQEITTRVNVKPRGKARFKLTYEEFLVRKQGRYSLKLNVNPGQVVKDFRIDVYINETLPVVSLRVPEFKTDPNAITSRNRNRDVTIQSFRVMDTSKVHVSYRPRAGFQRAVGGGGNYGMSGQFIVSYDLDRRGRDGNLIAATGRDGSSYFAYFFAPDDLPPLPKRTVFVIDVSGSMAGTKIKQTKDAMITMLDDLSSSDSFSIITFEGEVRTWHQMAYQATEDSKREAMDYVRGLVANGGTNLNEALLRSLDIAEINFIDFLEEQQPIIVFLTDGEPTIGETSGSQIRKNVQAKNEALQVPMFGLAFGGGADFELIKAISEENGGVARKISEDSDAAIQLEDFYMENSRPVLKDVRIEFAYAQFTENAGHFQRNMISQGNEMAISGKVNNNEYATVRLNGKSANGTYVDTAEIVLSDEFDTDSNHPIERLWAYQTINDLWNQVQEGEDGDGELRSKMVELAKEYNFVTPVTSLVVIKPERDDSGGATIVEKVANPVPTSLRNWGHQSGDWYGDSQWDVPPATHTPPATPPPAFPPPSVSRGASGIPGGVSCRKN